MLHYFSLDLFIKGPAGKEALRLKKSALWKQATYGHAVILEIIQEIGKRYNFESLTATLDYTTPYYDFDSHTHILFPSRKNWLSNSLISDRDITFFTDGSKNGIWYRSRILLRSTTKTGVFQTTERLQYLPGRESSTVYTK